MKNQKSPPENLIDSLLRTDLNTADLVAEVRKREQAQRDAAEAFATRRCGNCGQPRNQHLEVHQGFDAHTPIGPLAGPRTPLAVLCPDSIFKELS